MPPTIRWIFFDPSTDESWTMPINPNQMASPHPLATASYGAGVRTGLTGARTIRAVPKPVDWSFGGVVRSQAHHDALVAWAKRGVIHVTTHLGETYAVVLSECDMTERHPTATNTTRWNYVMKALLLRQETP